MKSILFNTEMVQAILEGRKTCTRRKIIRTPSNDEPSGYGFWKEFNKSDGRWYIKDYTHSCCWLTQEEYMKKYAPYKAGDILYVRETWKRYFKRIGKGEDCHIVETYSYKANDNTNVPSEFYEEKWKPSIHMPKVAARIFLKIKDVRVERLQDINGEDSIKEGIQKLSKGLYGVNEETNIIYQCLSPRDAFLQLWNSTVNKKDINKYGRKANPWVWVIEFERINKEEALKHELS